MIVAHRGASREAPENTIPAFKLAWEENADAIEGDFHLTRDGYIVCIHDHNTQRVSDSNLVVSESTLAELRKSDVGEYRGNDFKGSVIPTISEVFSTIPERKKIYIEIKCGTEIIPVLLEEIERSSLEPDQIVFICFESKVIQELKVKAPRYKTSWLCAFKQDESGNLVPSPEQVLENLKKIKADGLSSNANIPEPLIRVVRDAGYKWHVWTVDDPEIAKHFKRLGVDSITTNVPGLLKKLIV